MHSCILAELASQHHLSDYNCLRYGPKGTPLFPLFRPPFHPQLPPGSPIRYSPLSTTFPAQLHHLQLRQLQVADLQTAWHIASDAPHDAVAEHLSDQLQAAMDEPLTPQSATPRVKTSMTHPIKCAVYAFHTRQRPLRSPAT